MERPPHQHHRHARPRGLHRRGRALPCRARRCRSPSSTVSPAWSPRPRPCGARPTSTACPACASSTRWTGSGPTSTPPASIKSTARRQRRRGAAAHRRGGNYQGVVDLLEMKAPSGRTRAWRQVGRRRHPRRPRRPGEEYRHELIDVLSAHSDTILEKVRGRRGSPPRTSGAAPRRHHRQRRGSRPERHRLQEQGRAALLDAVVDYLPRRSTSRRWRAWTSTARRPRAQTGVRRRALLGPWRSRSWPTPRQALVLPGLQQHLPKGGTVLNSRTGKKERIGRLLEMHANHRDDRESVFAGDIVAGIGLKDTRTGDTLCDPTPPDRARGMEFPEPVIHVAVEPKTKADQDKLGKALYSLSEEDPTFQVRSDEETGQTVISGMGELHSRCCRPHAPRVQRGRHRRQAPGRLPRDHHPARRQGRLPPRQADRWFGPVRPRGHRPRAHRPRWRLRVRRQDHRRSHPEGVHPRSTRASSGR